MLYYTYKIVCFYLCIFNNNINIESILLEFLTHELLASISNNKI